MPRVHQHVPSKLVREMWTWMKSKTPLNAHDDDMMEASETLFLPLFFRLFTLVNFDHIEIKEKRGIWIIRRIEASKEKKV